MISILNVQPEIPEPNSYPCKSLNHVHRKKKLFEIALQNAEILQRLKKQKSQYNINIWKNERKKEENILRNICKFEYILNDRPKKHRSHSNSHSWLPKIVAQEKYSHNVAHHQISKSDSKSFIRLMVPSPPR